MVYSNGQLESEERGGRGEKGDPSLPGIDEKRLTDVADSIDEGDAVNLKVLKEHTQLSQNNYHLQPSFRFYKDFCRVFTREVYYGYCSPRFGN